MRVWTFGSGLVFIPFFFRRLSNDLILLTCRHCDLMIVSRSFFHAHHHWCNQNESLLAFHKGRCYAKTTLDPSTSISFHGRLAFVYANMRIRRLRPNSNRLLFKRGAIQALSCVFDSIWHIYSFSGERKNCSWRHCVLQCLYSKTAQKLLT